MTDTITPTWQDFEPVQVATVEVVLTTSEHCTLAAQVQDWPEEGDLFPAVTDITVDVWLHTLQLSPQAALDLAPRFAEFAQLLTQLAQDTITRVGAR